MTNQELYYKMLEERWEKVNKDNLAEVKAYNEWKRRLRKELLEND